MRANLPGGLVTLVFTDVVGSTQLAQVLGVGLRPMLAEYRRRVRLTLLPSGGAEASVEGDSCPFAFPQAGEALAGCGSAQPALHGRDRAVGGARPTAGSGVAQGAP